MTVKTQYGELTLQIDTGATCNVVPMHTYIALTKDKELRFVEKSNTKQITVFGDKTWPVHGEMIMEITRKGNSCLIRIFIIKGNKFHSILSKKACIKLGILKIMDNDSINQIEYRTRNLDKDSLIDEYKEVFNNKIGRLAGEHEIKLKTDSNPVKHAQRRVPIPILKEVQEKLNELEVTEIITRVTEPTPWISSMVVVKKKHRNVRICLDPKDFNLCIEQENYP